MAGEGAPAGEGVERKCGADRQLGSKETAKAALVEGQEEQEDRRGREERALETTRAIRFEQPDGQSGDPEQREGTPELVGQGPALGEPEGSLKQRLKFHNAADPGVLGGQPAPESVGQGSA